MCILVKVENVKNHIKILKFTKLYNNLLNCFLSPLLKLYIGFITSFTCVMVQSSGISFSNNFSLCKSQREQVPGSCSLRAHNRWKENVQLEQLLSQEPHPREVRGRGPARILHMGPRTAKGTMLVYISCQQPFSNTPIRSVAIPPDRPLLTKEDGQKCYGPGVIMGRYYKSNNHKVEYQNLF